jgi:hypothetical protein
VSGYQMTDAIGMPGGILEVGHDGKDIVMCVHGGRQVRLTAEGREEFRRIFAEAERRADAKCLCSIDGPGEVIPPACPVHGTPCDVCGGLESCAEDCGEAAGDPVGTVTDLRSQEPRTVTRDGRCLTIPALRLDAAGCKLLRRIINDELVELETGHG